MLDKFSKRYGVELSAILLIVAIGGGNTVFAEDETLEKVVIIGSEEDAKTLPGSGAVVDSEQMETEATTDINQVLKTVPGIYVNEEDGLGLRPNIGIRGATAERSEKITLMEDSVLIAPAPYSNPAAYYFPTAMRMSGIEVLKGAPLLRHGPQTTGGIVNMISTPIPEKQSGKAMFMLDERGSSDVHAAYGSGEGPWKWQFETVQRNSDGYKEIDRSNRDTGFNITDYVVKLGWQGSQQSVLLKWQDSDEVSNETYLGLTDADFDDNANRRYGLSSIDQMTNDHQGANLTYSIKFSDKVGATATAYRNEFSRDWFKLSGGGTYIDNANAGDVNAQGILDGTNNVVGLNYKHNNRDYISEGIQLNFDIALGAHRIDFGVRSHEDEMDRFQPVDVYDQVNGSLVYQSTTLPTGGDNRIEEAEAVSIWLVDDWQLSEALNVNLALRYEDVETSRVQYTDPARTTIDPTGSRSNDSSEVLPGASFTYDFNKNWQMLAGFHEGFSPLGGGAQENEEPETSDNWELGARYRANKLFVELIGFFSDFSNKTENCSVGSPCSNGATSGTFVTGEAEISGLEFQLGTSMTSGAYTVPVDVAYTRTKAEISEDNPVSGFNDGDQLKDVPESVFSLRAGLEHAGGWNNYIVAKYIDETCASVGCNNTADPLDETESLVVVDFISRYQLKGDTEIFFKAENVADEQKIVSRTPDGARPNKPLTLSMGMKYSF